MLDIRDFGWKTGDNSPGTRAGNKVAILAAVGVLDGPGTIFFPPGNGYCDTGIVLPEYAHGVCFLGETPYTGKAGGYGASVLNNYCRIGFIGSGVGISYRGSLPYSGPHGVTMRNLVLGYGGFEDVSAGPVPSHILGIAQSGLIENCLVHGASVANIYDAGWLIDFGIIGGMSAYSLGGDGLLLSELNDNTTVTLERLYLSQNRRGLVAKGIRRLSASNCVFESNSEEGILLEATTSTAAGVASLSFNGGWVEDNQRGKTSGQHYQIALRGVPDTYGFQEVTFRDMYFGDLTISSGGVRRLMDIDRVWYLLVDHGHGIFGGSDAVRVGAWVRGARFVDTLSVYAGRTFVDGYKVMVTQSDQGAGVQIKHGVFL